MDADSGVVADSRYGSLSVSTIAKAPVTPMPRIVASVRSRYFSGNAVGTPTSERYTSRPFHPARMPLPILTRPSKFAGGSQPSDCATSSVTSTVSENLVVAAASSATKAQAGTPYESVSAR